MFFPTPPVFPASTLADQGRGGAGKHKMCPDQFQEFRPLKVNGLAKPCLDIFKSSYQAVGSSEGGSCGLPTLFISSWPGGLYPGLTGPQDSCIILHPCAPASQPKRFVADMFAEGGPRDGESPLSNASLLRHPAPPPSHLLVPQELTSWGQKRKGWGSRGP